jgi:hypothetical protein
MSNKLTEKDVHFLAISFVSEDHPRCDRSSIEWGELLPLESRHAGRRFDRYDLQALDLMSALAESPGSVLFKLVWVIGGQRFEALGLPVKRTV